MNLLDRFLATVPIVPSQLQLVGLVCLFIASKVRQTMPLDPHRIVYYTDHSVTYDELMVSIT